MPGRSKYLGADPRSRRITPELALVGWALLTGLGGTLLHGLLPAPLTVRLAVGLVTILAVLLVAPRRFVLLAGRARWLFLSIVTIGLLATPGLIVDGLPWVSVEGLWHATSQAAHLLFALAMVAILMGAMTREEFVDGIAGLASVLRPVGLSPARLAVRLRLTLDYAEARLPRSFSDADTTPRPRFGLRR